MGAESRLDNMTKEFIILKSIASNTKSLTQSSTPSFQITIQSQLNTPSDLTFEIIYIGNPHSDIHDQILGEMVVGPLSSGIFKFDVECDPIVISKIPTSALFGVTSILIRGIHNENQFCRAGYFVNVSYPGLPNVFLEGCDEDELSVDENEGEELDEDGKIKLTKDEMDDDRSLVYESSDESEEAGDEEGIVQDEEASYCEEKEEEVTKEHEHPANKEQGEKDEEKDAHKRNDPEAEENEDFEEEGQEEEAQESESDEIDQKEYDLYHKNPDFQLKDLAEEKRIEINGFVLNCELVNFELCEPPLITQFDVFEVEDDLGE